MLSKDRKGFVVETLAFELWHGSQAGHGEDDVSSKRTPVGNLREQREATTTLMSRLSF